MLAVNTALRRPIKMTIRIEITQYQRTKTRHLWISARTEMNNNFITWNIFFMKQAKTGRDILSIPAFTFTQAA